MISQSHAFKLHVAIGPLILLRRPPTMSILRSLFYLFGVLCTSVAEDKQTTLDRRYICLTPNMLGCHGKSVRLAVYQCDENEPFIGSRFAGYDPLGLRISVHWGEHANDTSYPAPDNPGYERVNVNYATGETNSSLLRVLPAYIDSQEATSYFVHDAKNTSVYHTYDKPGIYRPIYSVCIIDPDHPRDGNGGCAISCGYDNYYVDKFNSTDDHETFCDPMPFYINADGTCSETPILPNRISSSVRTLHSGWIHLGWILVLATFR
jgi:hypothetical protein